MTNPKGKTVAEPPSSTDSWWLFRRVRDVRTAASVNWLRSMAVVGFYLTHLVDYLAQPELTDAQRATHFYATLIFCGWMLICFGIGIACWIRFIPGWAKYCTTAVDILLLTAALGVGAQTSSWLVLAYLLIIATAALRSELLLVIMSTGLSLLSYAALVGMADAVWFDENHATPLSQIAIVVLSILLAGAIGGLQCSSCRHWVVSTPQRKA